MISDERLEELARKHTSLTASESYELAKELLAHRKAWNEPVAYTDSDELKKPLCDLYIAAWNRTLDGEENIPLYRKPSTD